MGHGLKATNGTLTPFPFGSHPSGRLEMLSRSLMKALLVFSVDAEQKPQSYPDVLFQHDPFASCRNRSTGRKNMPQFK